jgi:hypothetical protein
MSPLQLPTYSEVARPNEVVLMMSTIDPPPPYEEETVEVPTRGLLPAVVYYIAIGVLGIIGAVILFLVFKGTDNW